MDHITIIGGDTRYTYTARHLRSFGWDVDTFQVQGSPDSVSASQLFRRSDAFLLPYPAFNAKGYLPFLQGETILHCSDLLPHCTKDTVILCGRPGSFAQPLGLTGARVIDYEQDEFLTTANAALTAEGALSLALNRMDCTLWQSRCLVTGFGRVGKQLSLRLRDLGARVTVAVRKPADQALIQALGMRYDTIPRYAHGLGEYQLILNTVPVPVFTPEHYSAMDPGCVLIDLASSPGGIDASQCLKRSLTFTHARGLPGRTAPATAGRLIAEAAIRTLNRKEEP